MLQEQLRTITRSLHRAHEKLDDILYGEDVLMASADDILNDVAELPTISDSLDSLFVQLAALIEAGKTDPAKLDQAKAIVDTFKDKTKAAIVANTPAAPTP
jgi:hypothetical protein